MLGTLIVNRCDSVCAPSGTDERYRRDLYTDMKIAIDAMKEFNEKLNTLHPGVIYKIKNIL